MISGDPEGRTFLSYPNTKNGLFFLLITVFIFFIYLFKYLFQNKLPEVPEYTKMQFHMMTLLDFLGKIAWVRLDFLSQVKISDILIRCARMPVTYNKATPLTRSLCYIVMLNSSEHKISTA